jgi:catechol 2,3-dioxygenase-like lactoylglutathione lyase family enzyme
MAENAREAAVSGQVRYLAIVSEQPERLAQFYTTYFKLRELGRSDAGDVALTDGFYNLSLLKPRPGAETPGTSHFGIAIDDIREIEGRLEEFAPSADIEVEAGDLFHGEYRVRDPFGQTVSLSTREFHAPTTERGFPSIRHLAMCVPNNDEVLDFYVNVFGFRENTTSQRLRAQGSVVRWAADGATAMALLPDRTRREINATESARDGLNHFGFLVTDVGNFLDSLPEDCVSTRPSDRPMAEYRGFDPDRNPFDISQDKGFEVDVGRWLHG